MTFAATLGRMLLSALLLSSSAVAGELVERASEAEALAADQKPVQALAAIEAAFNAAWADAPLGFSEALFVTERPRGFGIYEERPSAVFLSGEDMLVYAEPFGYGYGGDNGRFQIAFDADFVLRTATGQILHSQTRFAALTMDSRRQNKEFQVFITYNFKGLKPGDYVLVTRLTDKNSPKTGSFELPFTVAKVEDGAADAPSPSEAPRATPAPTTSP